MDEEASESHSCQLETRFWELMDENGKEETVQGYGVVGKNSNFHGEGELGGMNLKCPLQYSIIWAGLDLGLKTLKLSFNQPPVQ